MAYICKLSNNKFRAEISRNYASLKTKTFPSQTQAKQWAEDFESSIDTVPSLKQKKLKKLSPAKVESLGGLDLLNWVLIYSLLPFRILLMNICSNTGEKIKLSIQEFFIGKNILTTYQLTQHGVKYQLVKTFKSRTETVSKQIIC